MVVSRRAMALHYAATQVSSQTHQTALYGFYLCRRLIGIDFRFNLYYESTRSKRRRKKEGKKGIERNRMSLSHMYVSY